MYIDFDNAVPTDQKQRDYALGRLNETKRETKEQLRTEFGLKDDESPQSFNDLLARLTSGKYIYPENQKDKEYGVYSVMDYIRWRDPAVKEDEAGFSAANKKVDAAATTARDSIVLGNLSDIQKVLVDFKSATFH